MVGDSVGDVVIGNMSVRSEESGVDGGDSLALLRKMSEEILLRIWATTYWLICKGSVREYEAV